MKEDLSCCESDILNRQPFIDKLKKIIEITARDKGNKCFAINGAWGTGKTFILKRLSEQIENDYLVIHYNAWENDFYNEPLIAILSLFVDKFNDLNKNDNVLKSLREASIETIKNGFKKIIEGFAKKVLHVNIFNCVESLKENIQVSYDKNKIDCSFDDNLSLQQAKKEINDALTTITKEKTIVVLVDELDRCLPEYAIKVLERLHHVFNGVANLQVVLSIDKSQLENTIKTIFGDNVNMHKYLSKFIDFEIELDNGDKSDNFEEKFCVFCRNFQCVQQFIRQEHVNFFLKNIFENINVRQREKIIDKALMIHNIISKNGQTYDYSFGCALLLLITDLYLVTDDYKNKPEKISTIQYLSRYEVMDDDKIILKQRFDNFPFLIDFINRNYPINIIREGYQTIRQQEVNTLNLISILYYVFLRRLENNDIYYFDFNIEEQYITDMEQYLREAIEWLKILE